MELAHFSGIWLGNKRQWGQTESQEVLPDHQEMLFYSEIGWILKQATHIRCGVSVHGEVQKLKCEVYGEVQKASECGPGAAVGSRWPSLSRDTGHELQWTLPVSTVLWLHDWECMVSMIMLRLQILCGNREVWVHSHFLQSFLLYTQVQK